MTATEKRKRLKEEFFILPEASLNQREKIMEKERIRKMEKKSAERRATKKESKRKTKEREKEEKRKTFSSTASEKNFPFRARLIKRKMEKRKTRIRGIN